MEKYCVIGKSLPHTLSPEIHKLFGCDYGKAELVDESALKKFVESHKYCGFNVTIPYKEQILGLLDEIDDVAKNVGAVNTVVDRQGKLVGFNTDVGGMEYALRVSKIEITDKNVMILGSGGTSKTAAFVCKSQNAKSISVVSRTGELNYQNCYELTHTNVIINTTPIGMFPKAYCVPVDIAKFSELSGVFDVIYNPLQTLLVAYAKSHAIPCANGLNMLVAYAKSHAIPCANGLDMLIEQARLAHNIFVEECKLAGDICGEEWTSKVSKLILQDRQNISLIGIAGSGKSTIGHMLAHAIGKKFVDIDAEIEAHEYMTISDIFKKHGEAYFREVESEIVERECCKFGRVLSFGGGAVLECKNRYFIASNAVVVLICRPLENLSIENRPLSPNLKTAKIVFEQRKEIYQSLADIKIDNNGTIEDAVKEIIERL